MVKNHLKRLAAPSTWPVDRKSRVYISRPKGSFSLENAMPLTVILRDSLELVKTRKESTLVLNNKEISVNGKRQKEGKLMVGLMDVLTIKDIGKSFRILLDKNGLLRPILIEDAEATVRLSKITGKRTVSKGKVQLTLHDGRAMMGTQDHKVGDTIVLSLPKNEIKSYLKLENKCSAYLTGGSHVGFTGTVEEIKKDKVMIKLGNDVVEAARRFVLVVGKDKPVIKSVVM
jgi:small subunit ribosomal protein S4e